jgi:hypothetical protein
MSGRSAGGGRFPTCRGRPSRFPFSRACAKPALVRSRRISLSNSAKIASRPAIARPAGVVRSSASVRETNPTPRCSSSWNVASRSATDRPQRSSRVGQHIRAWRGSASEVFVGHSWKRGRTGPHEPFSPIFVPGQKRGRSLPSSIAGRRSGPVVTRRIGNRWRGNCGPAAVPDDGRDL